PHRQNVPLQKLDAKGVSRRLERVQPPEPRTSDPKLRLHPHRPSNGPTGPPLIRSARRMVSLIRNCLSPVSRFLFPASAFLFSVACVVPPTRSCPQCTVVTGKDPLAARVRDGTKTLFVIVPGLLGYGWEWDDGVRALEEARKTGAVDFVVFWYSPSES